LQQVDQSINKTQQQQQQMGSALEPVMAQEVGWLQQQEQQQQSPLERKAKQALVFQPEEQLLGSSASAGVPRTMPVSGTCCSGSADEVMPADVQVTGTGGVMVAEEDGHANAGAIVLAVMPVGEIDPRAELGSEFEFIKLVTADNNSSSVYVKANGASGLQQQQQQQAEEEEHEQGGKGDGVEQLRPQHQRQRSAEAAVYCDACGDDQDEDAEPYEALLGMGHRRSSVVEDEITTARWHLLEHSWQQGWWV
jgi:hypothetical protein